jgi:hypothetical protein
MESFKMFASPQFLAILDENAEANNIPRIGVPENVAFPAVQLNIAPAVAFNDCNSELYSTSCAHSLLVGR